MGSWKQIEKWKLEAGSQFVRLPQPWLTRRISSLCILTRKPASATALEFFYFFISHKPSFSLEKGLRQPIEKNDHEIYIFRHPSNQPAWYLTFQNLPLGFMIERNTFSFLRDVELRTRIHERRREKRPQRTGTHFGCYGRRRIHHFNGIAND